MRNAWRLLSRLAPTFLIAIGTKASGQPTAEPFNGQTIDIEIGYGPGGGYDTYARTFARHFGRFHEGRYAAERTARLRLFECEPTTPQGCASALQYVVRNAEHEGWGSEHVGSFYESMARAFQ